MHQYVAFEAAQPSAGRADSPVGGDAERRRQAGVHDILQHSWACGVKMRPASQVQSHGLTREFVSISAQRHIQGSILALCCHSSLHTSDFPACGRGRPSDNFARRRKAQPKHNFTLVARQKMKHNDGLMEPVSFLAPSLNQSTRTAHIANGHMH